MCNISSSTSSPLSAEEKLPSTMELDKNKICVEKNDYEDDSSSDSDSSNDSESEFESEDEQEKEWREKQRRIDKLAGILVSKDFPCLDDSNSIINTHRNDKKRLDDTVKVKRTYKKYKIIKRTREREIRSVPQQILREVVLKRARFYETLAYDRKKVINWALTRQEEATDLENQWNQFCEEESTYPRKIEEKATEIVLQEYPNLSVAEDIIHTHKRYPSRIHETVKGGVSKKSVFPVKIGRAKLSEPRSILRKNILRSAQNYKWYTNQRKETLKQWLFNEN